jgi:hypothetical protein
MCLTNASADTTLATFFLVTTNSGEDVGVLAGADLETGQTTNAAWFNVDRFDTDTFMIFFTDQNGTFWQSNGDVANLDSGDTWTVTVTVSGSVGQLQMGLRANDESFGPWPVFKVGSVNVPPGGDPPSNGNYMDLYNVTLDTTFAVYFLIVTNSGKDIGVLAGTSLAAQSGVTGFAPFNVDRGDTNTWIMLLVDQSGRFWQSNGIESNLPSRDYSTAGVIVSGDASLGQLEMVINTSYYATGTLPIFPVGTVYTPSPQ